MFSPKLLVFVLVACGLSAASPVNVDGESLADMDWPPVFPVLPRQGASNSTVPAGVDVPAVVPPAKAGSGFTNTTAAVGGDKAGSADGFDMINATDVANTTAPAGDFPSKFSSGDLTRFMNATNATDTGDTNTDLGDSDAFSLNAGELGQPCQFPVLDKTSMDDAKALAAEIEKILADMFPSTGAPLPPTGSATTLVVSTTSAVSDPSDFGDFLATASDPGATTTTELAWTTPSDFSDPLAPPPSTTGTPTPTPMEDILTMTTTTTTAAEAAPTDDPAADGVFLMTDHQR